VLDDRDLYHSDRGQFDRTSEALAKAQKQLQESEDRWLELEVLREEIEQA
jgi:ABC transport system ATP-binding/permease protein